MITQEYSKKQEALSTEESTNLRKMVTKAFSYQDQRGQNSVFDLLKSRLEENPELGEAIRYSLAERCHFNKSCEYPMQNISMRRPLFKSSGPIRSVMQELRIRSVIQEVHMGVCLAK